MGLRATGRKARFKRTDPLRDEGPLLLAMDTSSNWLIVALQRGGDLLSIHTAYQPLAAGRVLLPTIRLALDEQGFTLDNVDCFGAGIGPGSFTGVRVALTTVKALTMARNCPIAAIPSHELLALALPGEQAAGVLIDARKGELYSALFGPRPAPDRPRPLLLEPQAGSPEHGLRRLVEAAPDHLTLVGSAASQASDWLTAATAANPNLYVAPSRWHRLDGETLANAAMQRFLDGNTTTPAALEALYVGQPPIHKQR